MTNKLHPEDKVITVQKQGIQTFWMFVYKSSSSSGSNGHLKTSSSGSFQIKLFIK